MYVQYYVCNVYNEAINIYVALEIHHYTLHAYLLQDGYPAVRFVAKALLAMNDV